MVFCRAFLFYCAFFVLLSCSVQHRRYRPGIAVDWRSHPRGLSDLSKTDNGENENPRYVDFKTLEAKQKSVSPSEKSFPVYCSSAGVLPADSCDILVFRDGSEVSAKVLSSSGGKVRFYRCDLENGPEYVLSTTRLAMIKFANGERKGFGKPDKKLTPAETATSTDETRGAPRPNSKASTAFILSVIGIVTVLFGIGLLLVIVSLPFAFSALKDEKKSPGKYSNINLARVALGLDFLVLALYLLGLVILIYLMLYL